MTAPRGSTAGAAGAAAALLALGMLGTPAQAACDTGLAERMQAKLHPQRELDHGLTACRSWRGIPRGMIVVLPMPRRASLPGVVDYDVDVLLIQEATNGNTERAVVVSHLYKRYALRENHVRIEDIRIDTTHYPLAPKTRAFGVRVFYRDHTNERPLASETLSLYVPRGETLDKVLDEQELTRDSGEWQSSCTGRFDTARSNVSLGDDTSHGLRDIVIETTLSHSRSTVQGGECITQTDAPEFRHAALRFDGERYQPAPAPESSPAR